MRSLCCSALFLCAKRGTRRNCSVPNSTNARACCCRSKHFLFATRAMVIRRQVGSAQRERACMNGADIIAQILKREGTEFLACYPRNPLIEACAAVDIRPILCRQERVGVGMADGYSRIRRGRRNGVFAAQAGPGIENAFPGVAKAYTENVPMLVIPAGLPLARQYVRPVFRAADVYRPVTKWSALAHAVEELPDLMRRAYHAMRSGKGGPVMVEIPNEIFEAEYEGDLD